MTAPSAGQRSSALAGGLSAAQHSAELAGRLSAAQHSAELAGRLPIAEELARRVAGLIDQPDAFAAALDAGYRSLADPRYLAFLRRVTPGLGAAYGVRAPLTAPVHARLRRACGDRPDVAIWLAERLSRAPELETRALVCTLLRLSVKDDPERSWQLLRRLTRQAGDWLTVDTLAGVAALGILLEPYRWAELEQLVYSSSPWERRLVGASIASLPFEVVPADRTRLATRPALQLIATLLGDPERVVQQALAWALRSWHQVDPDGVGRFLAAEARRAAAERDGSRAWVLRKALPAVAPDQAEAVRARLAGLRRVRGAPSTSAASRAASAFADLLAASPAAAPLAAAPLAAARPAEESLATAVHRPERSISE